MVFQHGPGHFPGFGRRAGVQKQRTQGPADFQVVGLAAMGGQIEFKGLPQGRVMGHEIEAGDDGFAQFQLPVAQSLQDFNAEAALIQGREIRAQAGVAAEPVGGFAGPALGQGHDAQAEAGPEEARFQGLLEPPPGRLPLALEPGDVPQHETPLGRQAAVSFGPAQEFLGPAQALAAVFLGPAQGGQKKGPAEAVAGLQARPLPFAP